MKGIIAAIRNDDDFNAALKSKVGVFFDLSPSILTLGDEVGDRGD